MKEAAYKVLDWLTAGKGLKKKINGLPIRLPTRYINYFPSDYEAENFKFLKQYVNKGDVVLDIGAHIGVFSSYAAQLGGSTSKIYAFEPSANTFSLLKKTIEINKFENIIRPVNAAIGSYTGKISFFVSDIEGDNSNSLVAYKQDRKLNDIEVDIFSIDDFLNQYKVSDIKFMKIDVEGAELDALKGATYTLKRWHPFMIVAIHPEAVKAKGDRLEDIYDILYNASYKIMLNEEEIDKETFCKNTELKDYHLMPVKTYIFNGKP